MGFALVQKGQDQHPRTVVALDAKVCPSTMLFSQGYVQNFAPQVAVTDYSISVSAPSRVSFTTPQIA